MSATKKLGVYPISGTSVWNSAGHAVAYVQGESLHRSFLKHGFMVYFSFNVVKTSHELSGGEGEHTYTDSPLLKGVFIVQTMR